MEKLLPIKFFEKRKVDEQLTEAGGSKTPPKWVLEGDALTQHAQQLSGSMAKVSASFEAYKQEEHELPMVMTTIITEDALAKTHRKAVVDLLNSDNNANVISIEPDRTEKEASSPESASETNSDDNQSGSKETRRLMSIVASDQLISNINRALIEPEKAEIVRWIFDEILAGKSPAEVAKELNQKGVPSKRGGRWEGHVINGMLRNEKYTGDVLFQKTYTDDRFNRHVNRGEKNQYYMQNHHEAIVSHEVFDATNAIIEANGLEKGIMKNSDKYKNRYAMSGKIICGECGGTWKRVKLGNRFGFACNTHVKDVNACSMMSIKEDPVKAAFVTMMNKLTFARGKILVPYSEMLKRGSDEGTFERLDEIDTLLEKNMERRQQIMQFFTRGLLDPAVYAEENDSLTDEEKRLTSEKELLSGQMSGSHDQQEALTRLLRYTAKGKTITEFDDDLFTEHVDHVVVYKRTEIGFAMKCGPIFRERI